MALIGLLSDSHGRAGTTLQAVELLIERGAEVLVHLGDVGSEEVLDTLVGGLGEAGKVKPPVHVVFGNTDWDAASLGRYAEHLGLQNDHPVGRIEAEGKVVVFQHGHQRGLMEQALEMEVDYLCHGHSHQVRDERIGRTRVLNPGALFRAARHTVGLLDVAKDRFDVLTLP